MNINKVFICGRIVRDPELKKLPTGTSVCSFSVATNNVYIDKNKNKQQSTEFHNVVAWAGLADTIEKYFKKGDEIYIEGRIVTRSWDGKNGKQYRTEIVASEMQFGQKKKESGTSDTYNQEELPEQSSSESVGDIPF